MVKIKPIECSQCEGRHKSIFRDLYAAELKEMECSKRIVRSKKNEIIFEENAPVRGLYCIKSGKIKLTKLGINGKEVIVKIAEAGSVLGYRAVVENGRYTNTAEANESSELCFIPKEVFSTIVKENPKIASQIIQLYASELKCLEQKSKNTIQLPVKERMCASLLNLIDDFGYEKDGCTMNIVISRKDLADYTGTTRETISRFISELKKENIIELKGKKIKILRHDLLLKKVEN
jgi:CRP/FNR family transcriptional regulator, polysaccharide utilization system transcription regulator